MIWLYNWVTSSSVEKFIIGLAHINLLMFILSLFEYLNQTQENLAHLKGDQVKQFYAQKLCGICKPVTNPGNPRRELISW